jgi:hypothetical protein
MGIICIRISWPRRRQGKKNRRYWFASLGNLRADRVIITTLAQKIVKKQRKNAKIVKKKLKIANIVNK